MTIRSWDDLKRDQLAELFPTHDIWTVRHTTCRHTTWCSRPKGHPTATLNCNSADDLQSEIAQELADMPESGPDIPRIARKFS